MTALGLILAALLLQQSDVPRPPNIDLLLAHDLGAAELGSYLNWEFHERGGQQAARLGGFKAIRRDARTPSPFSAWIFSQRR
jgi:hypothetical protein